MILGKRCGGVIDRGQRVRGVHHRWVKDAFRRPMTLQANRGESSTVTRLASLLLLMRDMSGERNEVLLFVGLMFLAHNAFRCDATWCGLRCWSREWSAINQSTEQSCVACVRHVRTFFFRVLLSSHWWSWTPIKLLLGVVTMELSIAHSLRIPRASLG